MNRNRLGWLITAPCSPSSFGFRLSAPRFFSALMKLAFYAICALGLVLGNFGCSSGVGPSVSSTTPSAPAVVRIDFVNPGRFVDFRINGRDLGYTSRVFTRDVASALRPVMARRFPGHTLILRYTNIDLANRRTAGPHGLRVVPSNAPPWLAFDYVLQNPSGRTIASRSRRLVENEPTSSTESRSHPVQIEANLMRRWLQNLTVP
jgi:hypothetical protein